jgi:hypothetical protein
VYSACYAACYDLADTAEDEASFLDHCSAVETNEEACIDVSVCILRSLHRLEGTEYYTICAMCRCHQGEVKPHDHCRRCSGCLHQLRRRVVCMEGAAAVSG